ncbi:LacI family DNA-binding transcriptional regulator [Petrotoga sp. 9PWA.NaAc.5.4]|uniref:LacI family DNA-binding transcriptional regulator n=1 Tax=Petrotoga sp. 9PWA.NaAc.5.4 TaxID=1434328 RepID=UPI000CAC2F97|nr:LacI family DNA-binding transcriptional regulator [Petrotoga sp. 9PWA.NaAc.5.4]PNR96690.1 LacI family transcriptional regulator [Petrotoga sp. 9PWA.NaAc.5.4]
MPTIDDVAKLSGVSIATVSRVLNGKNGVSDKAKEAVLRAIEELDYKPSGIARNLANKRSSFNIGILISQRIERILNTKDLFGIREFYSTVLTGIESYAKENNINLSLKTFENCEKNFIRSTEGLLIIGGDKLPSCIKNMEIPKVLVDNYIPSMKVDSIISNGFDGAYYAIKKIIERGYKKIAHIHGSLTFYGFRNRYEGYVAAMSEKGLLPQTFECDETRDGIFYALNLALSKNPEIIFASNDVIALIILDELKKMKIKVPDDIQLIGFDDIISSSISEPKLSTLKVFKYEMGNIAVSRLIDLINGKNPHPAVISLFTTFVERESTIQK